MIHSHQRKLGRLELGTHCAELSVFPLGMDDAEFFLGPFSLVNDPSV